MMLCIVVRRTISRDTSHALAEILCIVPLTRNDQLASLVNKARTMTFFNCSDSFTISSAYNRTVPFTRNDEVTILVNESNLVIIILDTSQSVFEDTHVGPLVPIINFKSLTGNLRFLLTFTFFFLTF